MVAHVCVEGGRYWQDCWLVWTGWCAECSEQHYLVGHQNWFMFEETETHKNKEMQLVV